MDNVLEKLWGLDLSQKVTCVVGGAAVVAGAVAVVKRLHRLVVYAVYTVTELTNRVGETVVGSR